MSKIKNGGLDQYGAAQQQQFGTAGVEGVNVVYSVGRQQLSKCFTPVCPSTVQKAIETGGLFLPNAWKGLILVSNTVTQ